MSNDDRDQSEEIYIYGDDDNWNKIADMFFVMIEAIVNNIASSNGKSNDIKIISDLATKWVRSKIEKPSIESEKIRAETAKYYAEAKESLVRTEGIKIENALKSLKLALEGFKYVKQIQFNKIKEKSTLELKDK